MHRTTLVLVACLLLAVPVQAASIQGTVDADAVHFPGGFVGTGALTGFRAAGHSEGALLGYDLSITAEGLDVATNVRQSNVTVVGVEPKSDVWTEHLHGDNVEVTTTQARGLFDLMVAESDLATATLSSANGIVTQPTEAQIGSAGQVTADQAQLSASVMTDVGVSSAGPVRLTIRGDFALAIWDWDLAITDAGGVHAVNTGAAITGETAPGGIRVLSTVRNAQAFLFISNGTLELTLPQAASSTLYSPSLTVAAQAATLDGATGSLATPAGAQSVSGALNLEGQLRLGLEQHTRLATTVSGDVQDGQVDGHPLGLAAVPLGSNPWPWLLLVTPLLPAALGLLVRRRNDRAFAALEQSMEMGDYSAVNDAAPRFLRSRRHRTEAAVMATVSFLRTRQFAEAFWLLGELPLWAGTEPTRLYLLAHAEAAAGRPKEAARSVAACLELAPDMLPEVQANPALHAVLSDPLVVRHTAASRASREGYA